MKYCIDKKWGNFFLLSILLFIGCNKNNYVPFRMGNQCWKVESELVVMEKLYHKDKIISEAKIDRMSKDSSYWIGYYNNGGIKFRYFNLSADTTEIIDTIENEISLVVALSYSGHEYDKKGKIKLLEHIAKGHKCGEWIWFGKNEKVKRIINYGQCER